MAKKTKEKASSALMDAVSEMNNTFGSGTVQSFEDASSHDVSFISSGSLALDKALGGGYPEGRIIEMYGYESSGKTTLAMEAAVQVQKKGKAVLFLDLENAFDPEYGKALGLDYSKEKWIFSQPETGEDAFSILDRFVQIEEIGLIIVDSVSVMIPRAELEGEYGESKMGLHARLMSQGMRKLVGKIKKSDTTVIFINQLREKIGVMFGDPSVTTGGKALQFYASQRLRVNKKQGQKSKDDDLMSNLITVKVDKNKVAPPHKKAQFQIRFGEGIDILSEVLDYGVELDILQRKGAFYYYNELKLGQGAENARNLLKDNPELVKEIESKIKKLM